MQIKSQMNHTIAFGFGCRFRTMAATSLTSSTFLVPTKPLTIQRQNQQHHNTTSFRNPLPFTVQAAKLLAGVEVPKVEPKFQAPFLGFTRVAEIWNSRACMIGIIGVFIVELVLNKGILQTIGVDEVLIFLCKESIHGDKNT